MNIRASTKRYEAWLRSKVDVVEADLDLKHAEMRAASFPFLRATFYRWVERAPALAPELLDAPEVLAVGDLHIENFGTWRDGEGRLVWGVNDFDESYPLPYTSDLLRLATSAHVAVVTEHLSVTRREACDAILGGYRRGIEAGGRPFVLAEEHGWLRRIALGKLRDPVRYWKKIRMLPEHRDELPKAAERALLDDLPEKRLELRFARRIAGLGSLGRPRFVAIADWRGGVVARETKPLLPSACALASGDGRIFYPDVVGRAVRVPDPFLRVQDGWIARRLAPDCARIDLVDLPANHDESKLLFAMGFETANVHLGTIGARERIAADLRGREPRWLHRAVKRMTADVLADRLAFSR